eukprot:TRINITY_DN7084_c0_g1_i1.p1 TRINITY_DN7084_c0_g1~~TRINITY_DN7084_c0_g1_i1.p1  ORF type:complete len:410 (-),score=75.49 TRINITY_DN7084_c0_g1_i1:84-1286(-)
MSLTRVLASPLWRCTPRVSSALRRSTVRQPASLGTAPRSWHAEEGMFARTRMRHVSLRASYSQQAARGVPQNNTGAEAHGHPLGQQQQSHQQQQQQAPGGGGVPAEAKIVDVTEVNFRKVVLECEMPVILDCYANWCEPCKKLTPILENMVSQPTMSVRLAKLDVDAVPSISEQLQVQKLPTLFLFHRGKFILQYGGGPPEELQKFMEKARSCSVEDNVDDILAMANETLETGEVAAAAEAYQTVVQREDWGRKAAGFAGLARCALKEGKLEAAQSLAEMLRKDHATECTKDSEVKQALSAIDLAATVDGTVSVEVIQSKVDENPDDHCTRVTLAMALFARGDRKDGIDQALQVVRRDPKWVDAEKQSAKDVVLRFLDALGPEDKLSSYARKRLASLLFV